MRIGLLANESFGAVFVDSPGAVNRLNRSDRFYWFNRNNRFAAGWFVLRHHEHKNQIFVVGIVIHKEQREHHIWAHSSTRRLKVVKILGLMVNYFNFERRLPSRGCLNPNPGDFYSYGIFGKKLVSRARKT